jgi:hypothetical protein
VDAFEATVGISVPKRQGNGAMKLMYEYLMDEMSSQETASLCLIYSFLGEGFTQPLYREALAWPCMHATTPPKQSLNSPQPNMVPLSPAIPSHVWLGTRQSEATLHPSCTTKHNTIYSIVDHFVFAVARGHQINGYGAKSV